MHLLLASKWVQCRAQGFPHMGAVLRYRAVFICVGL